MAEQAISFRPKSVAQLGVASTIRNTYMLLSMSLLFCGFSAYISAQMGFSIGSPWLFLIGFIGLSYAAQALRNSGWGLVMVFALTGFAGLYLGPLLQGITAYVPNGHALVINAVGGTGAIFLALSGYVLVTRKDFSFLGGMVVVGLLVSFLAMLASYLFNLPALSLAVSAAFIFFSSAGILYTTSRMVRDPSANYILITVSLFAFLWNIFISLLHLLLFFSGRE